MNRSSPRIRTMLIAAVASASICLMSGPANAKDRDLGKLGKDSDKLEGLCADHNGKHWETADSSSYGCSYKGGGGIMCDADNGCLESDGQLEEGQQEEREASWGWAGLLGLAGLIGLAGRGRRGADPVR